MIKRNLFVSKPTKFYSLIPNEICSAMIANQRKISTEALGVYMWLYCMPDNWVLSLSHLAKTRNLSTYKTQKVINELIQNGYLSRITYRVSGRNNGCVFIPHRHSITGYVLELVRVFCLDNVNCFTDDDLQIFQIIEKITDLLMDNFWIDYDLSNGTMALYTLTVLNVVLITINDLFEKNILKIYQDDEELPTKISLFPIDKMSKSTTITDFFQDVENQVPENQVPDSQVPEGSHLYNKLINIMNPCNIMNLKNIKNLSIRILKKLTKSINDINHDLTQPFSNNMIMIDSFSKIMINHEKQVKSCLYNTLLNLDGCLTFLNNRLRLSNRECFRLVESDTFSDNHLDNEGDNMFIRGIKKPKKQNITEKEETDTQSTSSESNNNQNNTEQIGKNKATGKEKVSLEEAMGNGVKMSEQTEGEKALANQTRMESIKEAERKRAELGNIREAKALKNGRKYIRQFNTDEEVIALFDTYLEDRYGANDVLAKGRIQMLSEFLHQLPIEEQKKSIQQSISKGYREFYPVKEKKKSKSNALDKALNTPTNSETDNDFLKQLGF